MFLLSSAAALAGGISALCCSRKEKLAQALGLGGTAIAVAIGAFAA